MSKPKEKPVAAVASAGDEEKSSLYVRRLQDAGLPIKPVATTRHPPHFSTAVYILAKRDIHLPHPGV